MLICPSTISANPGDFRPIWAIGGYFQSLSWLFGLFGRISGAPGGEMSIHLSMISANPLDFRPIWPFLGFFSIFRPFYGF